MKTVNDEPILEFLVNYLWKKMPDQSSDLFLPKLLTGQNTSYDPYPAGNWDVGSLPESTDTVCAVGNDSGTCIGDPNLDLSEVVVKGLYNLQPSKESPIVNNTNVKATLDFCTLPMGTPYITSQYITITGNYLFTQLCKSDENSNQYTIKGTGTFIAQIFQAQGYGDMDIIPDPADPDNKLKVIVNEMRIIANPTSTLNLCTAPGTNRNVNICISIKMESGPNYNFMVNQVLNHDTISNKMIDSINDTLTNKEALEDLGDMLTTQINNILNGLDSKE